MATICTNRIFKSIHIRNIASNSFWNILAAIILRGNIFLVNIIIARIIGVELFGKYALLKSTVQVFETSFGLAIGLSMTKFISEHRYLMGKNETNNIQSIVKTNLITSAFLSFFLFFVLIFFSKPFAVYILKSEELLSLFKISIFYILFNNIVQCYVGVMKGNEQFRTILLISIFVAALNLAIVSTLCIFYSLKGAVIGLVLFSFIQLVSYIFVTHKYTKIFRNIFSRSVCVDFSVITKFNIPAIISGLAAAPAIWYINIMLSQTTNGFEELAYFNAAFQIFAIVVFMPISISDATFPIFNKYLSNPEKLKKIFFYNLLLILVISTLMSLAPFIFSDYIMSLFGSEFSKGGEALRYLAGAAILSSLLTFLGKFVATINKMWINLSFNYLWAISVTILSIYFINQGAVGVAKAFLVSYGLLFVLQMVYSIKSIESLT